MSECPNCRHKFCRIGSKAGDCGRVRPRRCSRGGQIPGCTSPCTRQSPRQRAYPRRVSRDGGEGVGDIPRTPRLKVEIAPVDDLALRVIGKRKLRRERQRKIIHRAAFRRGQRRCAYIIGRSGADDAQGKFILPCLLPAGGVLQIEVDTADICLPARGKRHIGIALRDAQSRVIVLAARELARDEIDAVRVNAGRYVNGCSGKSLRALCPKIRPLSA